MIKFFRHIRQRMITENPSNAKASAGKRVSKYMLYAIGEIILVVIGILIALSINNWNQERLESNKEIAYLDNLERDLQNQLSSIDIQLGYENKYIDHGQPILDNYHDTHTLIVDSTFTRSLHILAERKTFVRTDPTFEDLVSTGNLGLLKSNMLRNSLIEYYQELERIEKVIQNNNTLLTDQRYGLEITKIVYMGGVNSEHLQRISTVQLQDPIREMILINLLDLRTGLALSHVTFMNNLRTRTEEMLKLLIDLRI